MKSLFLAVALALPGLSFTNSESGSPKTDSHVRIYKLLLEHMNLNLVSPKRALIIGNSPRMLYDMRQSGIETYGLSATAIVRGYVKGLESFMPIKAATMALVITLRNEPEDGWLAMRVFQNIIGLVVEWGFLIVPEELERFNAWLPKWGFNLLPFAFSDDLMIWQRHKGDGKGLPINGNQKRMVRSA